MLMDVEPVGLYDPEEPLNQHLRGSSVSPTSTRPASTHALITRNLLAIGAVPLELFPDSLPEQASNSNMESVLPYSALVDLSSEPSGMLDVSANKGKGPQQTLPFQAAALLYAACRTAFRTTDCIKWEFIEDPETKKKSCILTITRPNGISRSYQTRPDFPRKTEAKAAAASLAMEMNVVDFINYGERDQGKSSKHGSGVLALAPLASVSSVATASIMTTATNGTNGPRSTSGTSDPLEEEDVLDVVEIMQCCKDWHADQVKPQYLPTVDIKPGTASLHGCGLKIQLTAHVMRAYSVHTDFADPADAKAAVAKLAIQQGVIDFIQHGNGQTEPASRDDSKLDWNEPSTTPTVTTLQVYHNSLPRPFPETPGLKPLGDTNPIAWVNTAVQTAKGSRLTPNYTFITNPKTALHGCLLRLDWNDDSRTYIVNSIFGKRSDAKSAVCLLAICQGLGDYIHSIVEVLDRKLTPELRKIATDNTMLITRELSRVSEGNTPEFTFDSDRGAFGCTMSIEVTPTVIRKYAVPMGYRGKADARCGAVLLALEHDVLEFIRFRGELPPPDYDPATYVASLKKEKAKTKEREKEYGERKTHAESFLNPREKRSMDEKRKDSKKTGVPPLFETREEALARQKSNATAGIPDGRKSQRMDEAPFEGQGPALRPGSVFHYEGKQQSPGSYPPRHSFPPDPPASSARYPPPSGPSTTQHPSGHQPDYHDKDYPYQQPYSALPPRGPYPPDYTLPPNYYALPPSHSRSHYHVSHHDMRADSLSRETRPPNMSYAYPPSYANRQTQLRPPSPELGEYVKDHKESRYPGEYDRVTGYTDARRLRGRDDYGSRDEYTEPDEGQLRVRRPSPTIYASPAFAAERTNKQSGSTAVSPDTKPISRKRMRTPSPTLVVDTTKSHVSALLHFCQQSSISLPEFGSEAVENESGGVEHKVWLIIGVERMELPMKFSSLSAGQERLAKTVLTRLRGTTKKRKSEAE